MKAQPLRQPQRTCRRPRTARARRAAGGRVRTSAVILMVVVVWEVMHTVAGVGVKQKAEVVVVMLVMVVMLVVQRGVGVLHTEAAKVGLKQQEVVVLVVVAMCVRTHSCKTAMPRCLAA